MTTKTVSIPHSTEDCGQCCYLAPLLGALQPAFPKAHINAWLGGGVHGVQIDLVDGFDDKDHAPRYVLANCEGASVYDDWAAALEGPDDYDCEGRENINFDESFFNADGEWTKEGLVKAAEQVAAMILRHPCCAGYKVVSPTVEQHDVFCPEGNYGPEVIGLAEWVKIVKS